MKKWRFIFALGILIPSILLFIRMLYGPFVIPLFTNADKILHFSFSALISISVLFLLKKKKWNTALTPIVLSCIFTIDELSQKFYSWRAYETMDLLVNLAGVAVAAIGFYIFSNTKKKQSST